MLRATCLALVLLLLGACGARVEDAEQILTANLAIPKDVEFRRMKTYPGESVCGEYSAYTSYVTPKEDFKPFITVRGTLYRQPLPEQLTIFCSKDPAEALLQQFGIGPYTSDNTSLAKISADYAALTSALERYYKDNSYYPTKAQGLQALVERIPDRHKPLLHFPDGGYIDSIPKDPWDRDYRYDEVQWGRVKGNYELLTLGADDTPGGSGENADVSSRIFPYLDHIAHVLGQR
ncbi:type II secretion system protein GspG [Haliea sp. E17]|uniref:type II secretion system protein GspG n=1 Tax=Haliea sp. E17 TaxID=3401576 RepID=UPI003AACD8ED